MIKLFDRVKVSTPTTGVGDITFGAAASTAFLTPTEAGVLDGDEVRYFINDGLDFEEGVGLIKDTVTTMERTVTKSKIGGVVGTSPINLSGTAVLALSASAADIGDMKGPSGAADGHLVVFDGATGKLVKDSGVNVSRLSNLTYRTPADFGAVGDGVSDDYSALVSCIQSGYPIDWGSQDKIYKIETEINETVTHAISWRSSGATIKYDGAGAPRSTVTLKVYPLVHQIAGAITFDGNDKAHAGLYVTNAAGSITGSVYPSLTASHVRAINIYRSNISFGSSCGILIAGDFEHVNLLHPYVKDVHGATAAQNPSIAGISGITVTRGTTDYPRNIFVLNPHVLISAEN